MKARTPFQKHSAESSSWVLPRNSREVISLISAVTEAVSMSAIPKVETREFCRVSCYLKKNFEIGRREISNPEIRNFKLDWLSGDRIAIQFQNHPLRFASAININKMIDGNTT